MIAWLNCCESFRLSQLLTVSIPFDFRILSANGVPCLILRPSVTRLIDELKHLPGIGQKTAQRLAFYLLRVDREAGLRAFRCDSRRERKSPRMFGLQQHHGHRPVPLLHRRHAQQSNHLRGGRSHEHPSRREDAAVQRAVSRAGRRAFAAARDRARSTENQKPDRASEGRDGGRNYRRDESRRPEAKPRPSISRS